MEIIEPHPLLIDYMSKAQGLFTDFDGAKKDFVDADEWHYVPSQLEQNIYLLRRLDERGLLARHNSVFDCGIGLATTMFDLYLQSQDIKDRTFEFGGVEKHQRYVDYLEENLIGFWQGKLSLVVGDIMDQDYTRHNIVYSYCPFKTVEKLNDFYGKLVHEMPHGGLVIEFRNYGKGHLESLAAIDGLEEIEIDDIYVYRKK